MTDPSVTPDRPDTAATAQFLRRFADLMSNGQNATYLLHAAGLLETLTVRVIAAVDEEKLWRYKYETVTRHTDALEAESEALKHTIEGHVNIAASLLNERDALKTMLEGRETELSELHSTLHLERGHFATKLEAHERGLAELLASFEQERGALEATARARSEELDALRLMSKREREECAAALKTAEQSFADRCVVLEYERTELDTRLRASDDEREAFRIASRRECDELQEKVASLEFKRAEIRSAFERINDMRNQTIESHDGVDRALSGKPGPQASANPDLSPPGDRGLVGDEANAVVPKATLRQARAQFEYLARQCISRGDIASQVMCELGAHAMDEVLTAGAERDAPSVGEVALDILAASSSTDTVIAENARV
jgi:hypothetical protein